MPGPVKESVAIVIYDEAGRFLTVKRAEDDDSLPGVWGLPGASLRGEETPEHAAVRAGMDKLGVKVAVHSCIGEDYVDRGDYARHLREYEVRLVEGTPSVPQSDPSVSQYDALQYTDDPTILLQAAREGSLCSRIFLRRLRIDWGSQ